MKKKNANIELNEFIHFSTIDPLNEYHLGTPILCKPKLDDKSIADIEKCKYIDLNNHPEDYRLLVLKYGGHDLKVLCNSYLNKYLSVNKSKKSDKFWLEVHHLIRGLKFFKQNGLVHNDIKPQNILFDSKTGKFKFIDFGLMRSKENIIKSSQESKNYLSIFHWSYPLECGFMNKDEYMHYLRLKKYKKELWEKEFINIIVNDSEKKNSIIKSPNAFKILFSYIDKNPTLCIESFFNGFNDLVKEKSYEEVLNLIIDSIDVYGLGFSLQYILNCFKENNNINSHDYELLSFFFKSMYNFNPLLRELNIDNLLIEYEKILYEMGILYRLKKTFKNHKLVKKFYDNNHTSSSRLLTNELNELNELANKDPSEFSVSCSKDKIFNPFTKKCVKKCKKGYSRNMNFTCKKTRRKRH
jgi:serine/threonine protein kinase